MYSKFMHVHSIKVRAYGFAYDDDQQQDTRSFPEARQPDRQHLLDGQGPNCRKRPPTVPSRPPSLLARFPPPPTTTRAAARMRTPTPPSASSTTGDWLNYNALTFNPAANAIDCVIASGNSGGKFEVRLVSMTAPNIGECTVQATGGWSDWKHVVVPITPTRGTHNLFIVAHRERGICNFKEFSLIVATAATSPWANYAPPPSPRRRASGGFPSGLIPSPHGRGAPAGIPLCACGGRPGSRG